MKRIIIIISLFVLCLGLQAQITENPSIGSCKSQNTTIDAVFVNFLSTVVMINFRNYVIYQPQDNLMISPEAYIEYKSPSSGEIKREKIIMAKRLINSEHRYENVELGKKYNAFIDFGKPPVDWTITLSFPALENGTKVFSVYIGYKGLYWKNINIEETDWSSDWEGDEKEVEKAIEESKSIYAGKYESEDNGWPLAFVVLDELCALINLDATNPGWSIGDIWADLHATTNPNVFIGTRYISNRTERKIVVTFEKGRMSIKEGDNVQQYLKKLDR